MHVTGTAHTILKLQGGWLTNANTQDSIIIFHNDKWPSAFINFNYISLYSKYIYKYFSIIYDQIKIIQH